jgi:hypothetical protein
VTEERPEPVVELRSERPYVGIRRSVTLATFGEVADELPRLVRWAARHGVERAGPPFFRFRTVSATGRLDVEAGIGISPDALRPDVARLAGRLAGAEVGVGSLPAGRYASLRAHGRPTELSGLITELLAWASDRGLTWDRAAGADGETWGCRLEAYRTCPFTHPALHEWDVELAFRLAD